ncbi:unnamed protein product, partial [Polarella glacialis]
VHVRARLDVTIRVKDAMLLLDKAGLLTFAQGQPELQEPHGSVFSDLSAAARPPSELEDTRPATAPIAELQGLKDFVGHPSPSPFSSLGENQRRVLSPEELHEAVGPPRVWGCEPAADAAALEEFLRGDFRADYLAVLRIITEVLRPEMSARICWNLGTNSLDEHVALLDFLETELTFIEFQRLLLRFAEHSSRQAAATSCIPSSCCLENFLKNVFMPALEKPYLHPAPLSSGEATGEDVAEAAEVAKEPVNDGFWRGFCDEEELELALTDTPRATPDGYLDEVGAW